MKNSFYNAYRQRHNIPTMDEKLQAAGVVVSTGKGVIALEREIIDLFPGEYDKAAQIIRECWAGSPLEAVAIRKLEFALEYLINDIDFNAVDADEDSANLAAQVLANL